MTGWDSQKYGDLAENLFERLILPQFHFTKPQKDLDGWDFLLRLRTPTSSHGFQALLKQPPPFRYLVQVKSVLSKAGSSTKSKRISVPLDRLLNAAKDSNPWFYFVVRHTEAWDPLDVFIFHVDRFWIEKVAKRLSDEPTGDRSKMTLDLTLSDKNSIEATEQAVHAYINAACGDDSATYSARKKQWWERAGLEKSGSTVTFTTDDGATGAQAVSDLLLGLRSIGGAELKAVETRFGRNFEEVVLSNGQLRVEPSAHPVVSFSSRGSDTAVVLQSKLYRNSGLDEIFPGTPFAVRIDANVIDVLIYPVLGKAEIRLTPVTEAERVKIGHLSASARLLNLFNAAHQGGEVVNLRLGAIPGLLEEPIELPFSPDHALEVPAGTAHLCERGHALSRFARFHGVVDDFECDPAQLLYYGPAIEAALMLSGIEKQNRSVALQLKTLPLHPVCIVPIAPAFAIGQYHGYATGYIRGKLQASGETLGAFTLSDVEIVLLRSEFGTDDMVTQDRLNVALEQMGAECDKLEDVEIFNWAPMVCRSFRRHKPDA